MYLSIPNLVLIQTHVVQNYFYISRDFLRSRRLGLEARKLRGFSRRRQGIVVRSGYWNGASVHSRVGPRRQGWAVVDIGFHRDGLENWIHGKIASSAEAMLLVVAAAENAIWSPEMASIAAAQIRLCSGRAHFRPGVCRC